MSKEENRKLVTIKAHWMHSFDEDKQTRHHTYTGIAVIHSDDQHVIIKREIIEDHPKGSPPEMEQQIEEWCRQIATVLHSAQEIEITNEKQRWEY